MVGDVGLGEVTESNFGLVPSGGHAGKPRRKIEFSD
jgi:hypothetical protein